MLFCWHADTYDASALPRWSEWYPGDAYVDIVSFSRYNDASPASIDDASRLMETGCNKPPRHCSGENLGLGRVRVRGR